MTTRIDFGAELRELFFDREGVRKHMDRKKRRALGRVGAYTRTTARRDMLRRRQRPARPDQPPSVHSRDRVANLRNIRFASTPAFDNVIIGPLKLHSTPYRVTIPELLEKGGTVRIVERRPRTGGRWLIPPPSSRRKPGYEYRRRTVRYPARPFMVPAMKREAPKFPSYLAE